MTRRVTLLLSSAGRRVELLNCFRKDAADLGITLRVVAVDANPALSAACQAADASFAVPRLSDPRFIDAVQDICRREHVGLVVPTIDTELAAYAAARDAMAADGITVAVSSPDVVAIARDKLVTARQLALLGVPTPRTEPLESVTEYIAGSWTWPGIIKPRDGSASKGLRIVTSAADLGAERPAGTVLQQYLEGDEYTVNFFVDREGGVRAIVPHRRLEVRAGEVSKGVTTRHEPLIDATRSVALGLPGARGALCLQAVVSGAEILGVFEINARFGGGFPLAHRAGARFSRWLLQEASGTPSDASDDWKEGVVMLRYDAAVFTEGGGAA